MGKYLSRAWRQYSIMPGTGQLQNEPSERSENREDCSTQIHRSESHQYDTTELTITETQQYDFSELPVLVWIMIMSNLEERDRLVLAVTCTALYDVSHYVSSLWRSATLRLANCDQTWNLRQVELNATEISVLQAHSHQIQNMVIQMYCPHGVGLSRRSFLVLKEAIKTWPLKTLSIACIDDDKTVHADEGHDQMLLDAHKFISYCLKSEKAKGLEQLRIGRYDFGSSILEMLSASSFTSSLKDLTLGTMGSPSDMIDFTSEIAQCLGRFQNLQILSLWIEYLSDPVVETLSHSTTDEFKHLILFGDSDLPNNDISITKWPQLTKSCPKLRVDLSTKWIDSDTFLALFPPTAPVGSLDIFSLSDTGNTENEQKKKLIQLLPVYSQTLTCFKCFDEKLYDIDTVLIDMVKRCPDLVYLVMYGKIKGSSIATMFNSRNWEDMVFLTSSITSDAVLTGVQTDVVRVAELEMKMTGGVDCTCEVCCTGCRMTYPITFSDMDRPVHFKVKCQPAVL